MSEAANGTAVPTDEMGGGAQRPAPRFEERDRITPGPDSTLDLSGEVGVVTDRRFCGNCGSWHYMVVFEHASAQMLERNMQPADEPDAREKLPARIIVLGDPSDYPEGNRKLFAEDVDFAIAAGPTGKTRVVKDRQGQVPRIPTPMEIMGCKVVTPDDVARILGSGDQDASPRDGEEPTDEAAPSGWQGTQPAEGTRRRLILDAINGHLDGPASLHLGLADAIESALLKETIDAEEEEEWDVALDEQGRPYVALDKLTDFLLDLEAQIKEEAPRGEEATEKAQPIGPGVTAIGGRSGGKREAMRQVIRENAATDEDAEQVLDALESIGRAFMLDGRFVAEQPQPGAVEEVEAEPSLFDLLLSHLPGRRGR